MRTELIIDDNTVYEVDLDCLYNSKKKIGSGSSCESEIFSINNINNNTNEEEEGILIMTKSKRGKKKELDRVKWLSLLLFIYLFNPE